MTGIYQHLGKSGCADYDRRIFRECGPAPSRVADRMFQETQL